AVRRNFWSALSVPGKPACFWPHGENVHPRIKPRAGKYSRITKFNPIEQLERRQLLSVAVTSGLSAGKPNPVPYVTFTPDPRAPHQYGTFSLSGGPDSSSVGTIVNINHATGNQSEVEIAINKANPQQVFAVWNGSSTQWGAYSTNGGATWTVNNPFSGIT